jgi:hypothetical protein
MIDINDKTDHSSAGITGIVKAVLVVSMSSTDFTYERVDLTIWTLTEPAASIMAVSIPILSVPLPLFLPTQANSPRRMLYRELKSSHYKYKTGGTGQNDPRSGHMNTNATDARKSKRFGPHSKYGRNSVVIMSNAGWDESQEGLQDADRAARAAKTSPNQSGVLKTEEVRVYHERLSTVSDENSIELKVLGPADKRSDPDMSNRI